MRKEIGNWKNFGHHKEKISLLHASWCMTVLLWALIETFKLPNIPFYPRIISYVCKRTLIIHYLPIKEMHILDFLFKRKMVCYQEKVDHHENTKNNSKSSKFQTILFPLNNNGMKNIFYINVLGTDYERTAICRFISAFAMTIARLRVPNKMFHLKPKVLFEHKMVWFQNTCLLPNKIK